MHDIKVSPCGLLISYKEKNSNYTEEKSDNTLIKWSKLISAAMGKWTLYVSRCDSLAVLVLQPGMNNLNLIKRKHQTNPKWGAYILLKIRDYIL